MRSRPLGEKRRERSTKRAKNNKGRLSHCSSVPPPPPPTTQLQFNANPSLHQRFVPRFSVGNVRVADSASAFAGIVVLTATTPGHGASAPLQERMSSPLRATDTAMSMQNPYSLLQFASP